MKHLREITIQNFAGHETEVALVRYLLENTCILEEMNICLPRELTKNADYKLKVPQQFSLFKVMSPHVDISLIEPFVIKPTC